MLMRMWALSYVAEQFLTAMPYLQKYNIYQNLKIHTILHFITWKFEMLAYRNKSLLCKYMHKIYMNVLYRTFLLKNEINENIYFQIIILVLKCYIYYIRLFIFVI